MKVRSEIPTAENTTNMDGFGTCEVGTTLENLKARPLPPPSRSTSASSTRSSPKSSPTSRSRPPLRPRACRPT